MSAANTLGGSCAPGTAKGLSYQILCELPRVPACRMTVSPPPRSGPPWSVQLEVGEKNNSHECSVCVLSCL